jgi:hypothetical protein
VPTCRRKEAAAADHAVGLPTKKSGAADVATTPRRNSKRVSREQTEGVGEMPEHQVRRLAAGMRFVACFFDFLIMPHADDREV